MKFRRVLFNCCAAALMLLSTGVGANASHRAPHHMHMNKRLSSFITESNADNHHIGNYRHYSVHYYDHQLSHLLGRHIPIYVHNHSNHYPSYGYVAGIPKVLNGHWATHYKKQMYCKGNKREYQYYRLVGSANSRWSKRHLSRGGFEPGSEVKLHRHSHHHSYGSGLGEFWYPEYRKTGHNSYRLIQGGLSPLHGDRHEGYRLKITRLSHNKLQIVNHHHVNVFYRVK